MKAGAKALTRNLPIEPGNSALLVIDVQTYCCAPDGGMFAGLGEEALNARFGEYLAQLRDTAVPNLQRAIAACRAHGVEVIYTYIEALTRDGRDQSLDYRISGICVPRGARDAEVLAEIAPGPDDIRLPKTASSVFNATNIDYVLRNLGIERVAMAGVMTDQCVESAVRDACDRGYLVTVLHDACAALNAERHAQSLRAMRGYCRQIPTADLLRELPPKP